MKKFLAGTFAVAVLFVAVSVPFVQRQQINDWYVLQSYEPSLQVKSLADATSMSDYGRKLFYVNDPQVVADKVSFTAKCNQREQSIVLGCYISNDGIYLYQVTDTRLNGIVEVTAAHEMLHVGYERLNRGEKERIDELLMSDYKKITDARVLDTIKAYQDKDPSVVLNELHSILPTEVETLSSELEEYYKKFFNDRTKVTGLSQKYENEFVAREKTIEAYDNDLTSKKSEIDRDLAQIDRLADALSTEKARLDNYRQLGDITSYNNSVPIYNQMVNQYNALVRSTQQTIDEYNIIVEKRNSAATDIRILTNSIDSRPQLQN